MDEAACNYDSAMLYDDGSCEYADYSCVLADGSTEIVCDEAACDLLDATLEEPSEFRLSQNNPNPFNPVTTIEFDVASNGSGELKIYDIVGNYVNTLVSGYYTIGKYTVQWDGLNNIGRETSSGVYIYQFKHNEGIVSKKMILLR